MEQFILRVKSTFFNKEFMKFIIVGVINTFNSTVFALLYGLVMAANLAFVGGYITNLCIGYILNSRFIFYQKFTLKGLIKFSISYIPNFIIQNSVVVIVYNILGLPSIIAYMIAAVIGVPITFLCVKFFTFGNKK